MPDRSIGRILLIGLAIVGAIALIALLGMWLMMAGMMSGGMTGGGIMECCRGLGIAGWLLGLLTIAGVIAAVILLIGRNR